MMVRVGYVTHAVGCAAFLVGGLFAPAVKAKAPEDDAAEETLTTAALSRPSIEVHVSPTMRQYDLPLPPPPPPVAEMQPEEGEADKAALKGAVLPNAPLPQKPAGPYSMGGGKAITINGKAYPRDVVFRTLPVMLPLQNIRVTSLYGYRNHPVLGYRAMHRGVDLAAPTGTPAYSTAAGIVTHAGWSGAYGNMVEIQHQMGFTTRYGHLSRISVRKGQVVDRHSQVGLVGATGRVTGPHLHFEIRNNGQTLDPIAFLIRAYQVYRHLD